MKKYSKVYRIVNDVEVAEKKLSSGQELVDVFNPVPGYRQVQDAYGSRFCKIETII